MSSTLTLIGIGPGDLNHLTFAAQTAIQQAEVIIGYQYYLDLIASLLSDKQQIIVSSLGREIDRAEQAIDLAASGKQVALISSGDIGIYAMAGPVFEVLRQRKWQGNEPEVEVLPGISAIQAAAAKLGAPLSHDFCTISLSDLLTPWPLIERRLVAAAWGDFVIGFYNPRSQKRDWQLAQAKEILLKHRPETTPIAIVRNITRTDETVQLTTLVDLDVTQVDMFTLVVVGNSQSYIMANHIATPRGYTHTLTVSRAKKLEPIAKTVYPVTLTQIASQRVVVVGGGFVGERKIRGLLKAEAKVYLISPEVTDQIKRWVDEGKVEWMSRAYQAGDLAGAYLIFAATNDRATNAAVSQEASLLNTFCNVVDRPDEGDFHLPAVHEQTDAVIAVSTRGQSPGRARLLRDKISQWLAKDS
ncbi:MAG: precorrin-3B C(17)-methyltransferase [Chloroflexota bacterium]